MPKDPNGTRRASVLLALMLLVGGCEDSSNIIGPKNEMEVTNATDTFQWQVSALSKVTQTLRYDWENTGTRADVNLSSSLGAGSATLLVTDAEGIEVFSRSLAENGTFETAAGAPGTWTVTITLTKVTGTLNFRLQAP